MAALQVIVKNGTVQVDISVCQKDSKCKFQTFSWRIFYPPVSRYNFMIAWFIFTLFANFGIFQNFLLTNLITYTITG